MELPHSLKTLPFVILNKNVWETITVITAEYKRKFTFKTFRTVCIRKVYIPDIYFERIILLSSNKYGWINFKMGLNKFNLQLN